MIHLVAQTGGFGSASTVVFAVFLVLKSFQVYRQGNSAIKYPWLQKI